MSFTSEMRCGGASILLRRLFLLWLCLFALLSAVAGCAFCLIKKKYTRFMSSCSYRLLQLKWSLRAKIRFISSLTLGTSLSLHARQRKREN